MRLRRGILGLLLAAATSVSGFAQGATCTFDYFQLTQPFDFQIANGINRYGTVVGTACGPETPDDCLDYRGFIRYSDGSQKVLAAPNSTNTIFNRRNASGITVGETIGTAGHHHGIVYYNGQWRTVDYPGAAATALTGINMYGTMVGIWTDSKGLRHGFRYKNGVFLNLNYPGAKETMVRSISDKGVIVGSAYNPNWSPASTGFILKNGSFTAVTSPNRAVVLWDINASGTIVGDDQDGHAFILKNGTFYEVADSNTVALVVRGINGYGTITGEAQFGVVSYNYTAKCTTP